MVLLVFRFLTGNKQTPQESLNSFLTAQADIGIGTILVSCPIDDDDLDSYRQKCAAAYSEHPTGEPGHYCNDEGMKLMRQMIVELSGLKTSG